MPTAVSLVHELFQLQEVLSRRDFTWETNEFLNSGAFAVTGYYYNEATKDEIRCAVEATNEEPGAEIVHLCIYWDVKPELAPNSELISYQSSDNAPYWMGQIEFAELAATINNHLTQSVAGSPEHAGWTTASELLASIFALTTQLYRDHEQYSARYTKY